MKKRTIGALIMCLAIFTDTGFSQKLINDRSSMYGAITGDKMNNYGIEFSNEKSLFVKLGDKTSSGSSNIIELRSVDKKSMKERGRVEVYNKEQMGNKISIRHIVPMSKGFMVFYKDETNKKDIIVSGQFYDYRMKPSGSRKKVFRYNPDENSTYILSSEYSDKVAVLTQDFVEKGQPIKIDYSIYSAKLRLESSGQIDMEVKSTINKKKAKRINSNLLSNLDLTPDGNFIGVMRLKESSEKRADRKNYVVHVDAKSNGVTKTEIAFSNDAFLDEYIMIREKNKMKLVGFYSDAKSRSKRNDKLVSSSGIEGTFVKSYDYSTKKFIEESQAPFDDDFMFNIAAANPFSRSFLGKETSVKDADDINDAYRIQDVIFSGDEAMFYCEYIRNSVTTSTTTTNGVTRTTRTYKSLRGNLFYFKISLTNGEFVWGNTIRKRNVYSSGSSYVWYLESMQVIPGDKYDAVIYYTDRAFNPNDKSDLKGEKFNTKKLKEDFVTSFINNKNGQFETVLPELSPTKLRKGEKVQIQDVYHDNYSSTLYTINKKYKIRWAFAIPCFILSPIYVGWYVWTGFPNLRYKVSYSYSRLGVK